MISLRSVTANVLIALAGLCAAPARADLNTAVAAYERGEFSAALAEFRRLALIGNVEAQYNLGLMLVQGQGGPRDLQAAFNWLETARANGDKDGESILVQLRPMRALDPLVAKRHAEDYSLRLQQHLQLIGSPAMQPDPAIELGRFSYRWNDSLPLHPDAPEGILGSMIAALVIDDAGRVEDVWELDEYPTMVFDGGLQAQLLTQQFPPARRKGIATGVIKWVKFRTVNDVLDSDVRANASARRAIAALREARESGDIGADVNLGRLAAAYPELKEQIGPSTDLFRKAAERKFVDADYQLGFRSVFMADSLDEYRAGISRLDRAARAGYAPAQFLIAMLVLAAEDKAALPYARDLLDAAVAGGHKTAGRYLAGLLAASPIDSVRDGRRSRELIESQLNDPILARHPLMWEIAAAASAETGDFESATAKQQKAIALAVRSEPPGSLRLQRLQSYQARKPWRGPLPYLPSARPAD